MVASTDIKFYVHTNTNAPQLTNNFGCMIDVLDACLVNGFGSQAVSTLTASGTTVTATFSSNHNLMRFQVVEITGAAQAEYNGEHRILSVPTANSITFEVATAPSASPATGTIVASLPSLGWSLPFTGTGKRAYKNTDIDSPYLRVVDGLDPAWTSTYAKYAKVGIVEDMTDIDTMLGHQAPYDSANPNKNWVGTGSGGSAYNGWAKWIYAASDPAWNGIGKTWATNGVRGWVIVGDGTTFYIFNKMGTAADTKHIAYGFGKLINLSKINASAYFLSATDDYKDANSNISTSATGLLTTFTSGGAKVFFFKNYKNESAFSTGIARAFNCTNNDDTGNTNHFMWPTTEVDLFRSEYILVDNSNVPRGSVPILKWLHNSMPYSHLATSVDDQTALLAISCTTARNDNGQIVAELGVI